MNITRGWKCEEALEAEEAEEVPNFSYETRVVVAVAVAVVVTSSHMVEKDKAFEEDPILTEDWKGQTEINRYGNISAAHSPRCFLLKVAMPLSTRPRDVAAMNVDDAWCLLPGASPFTTGTACFGRVS